MRGSSLNDETIGYVAALPSVRSLDLSKTSITDAGLALLRASKFLSKLNLSDTKITAKGLLACSLPSYCEIQLATGQFTSAEIKRLRARWKVIISDANLALGE
ncbi:MAG TPA: hypothetical protein VM260_25830 [Pirellula sp.]|nr:hypothetical protein [Pirellula sp.]